MMRKSKKRCAWCRQYRGTTVFSTEKGRPDGLSPYCKPCVHRRYVRDREASLARAAAYYRANKKKCVRAVSRYRQKHPERVRECRRRHRLRHLDKIRARDRIYYLAHAERLKRIARERFARYPHLWRVYAETRRARLLGLPGFFTDSDVQKMRRRQRGRCFYCGGPAPHLQIEHKIPVTRAGATNWPSNLCLACGPCNNSKKTKTGSRRNFCCGQLGRENI